MYVIAQAPGAANAVVPLGVSTAAAALGIYNVIAGEPGAGTQLNLSIPGSNRLNGQPFRVRTAGFVSLAAGTYTTSVQTLLHASTTAGFTATAANAVFSAAAVAVTISAATAKVIPWFVEAIVSGDSTSGLLNIVNEANMNNGAQQIIAPAVGVNLPTAVNFATEPPLQFAASVQIGATANTYPLSAVTASLTQFQIEA